MRKLFLAALIIAAAFSVGLAQGPNETKSTEELLKMGRAPQGTDGIGRAVIEVEDMNGNPVPFALVNLSSIWGGDQFCESYGQTNKDGVIALLPIHMGKLKLKVKAKGYRTEEVVIDPSTLGAPVVVKMEKK
ncbi:MAG: carboxypeptidase regulatory-like domain-containing protein [Pyrinomonadaceae bacterium]|nr:carboxypeptidase regulatory-like domain-containing protein [Pyrinomonadaceae bacterium]